MANDVISHESVLPKQGNRDRCKTDVFYLYVFGLFFVTYIAISTYVYVVYHDENNLYKDDNNLLGNVISPLYGIEFEALEDVINNYGFNKTAAPFILATLFYLLFFCFFIALLRWAPKILLYLTRIMLYIFIIVVILFWSLLTIVTVFFGVETTLHALKIENSFNFFIRYVVPGLSLIVLVPTVICLKKEGVKAISEILKNSCSALVCFRSALYFVVFILFYFVIVVMEILLLLFMKSIYFQNNLSGILLYICILGGFYMCSFLYCFGITVMSNTIASWHYNQDNEEIPIKSVCESIGIVCRFHLGTIAFGATVILPFILAICTACRHTVERCNNPVVARIFKLVLIGEITNFALIQTSVHGYNFGESTKRSFDLMVKRYSISLVLIKMFEFMMSFIVELPLIFSMLLIAASDYFEGKMELNMIYEYGTISQILTLPIFMIVRTSVNTTLLYRLEKEELEESAEMNTFVHIRPQNGNVV